MAKKPWRFVKWVFPKIGAPQNEWFIMENPIKMDNFWGVPQFFGNIQNIQIYIGHSMPPILWGGSINTNAW